MSAVQPKAELVCPSEDTLASSQCLRHIKRYLLEVKSQSTINLLGTKRFLNTI
jgi:hypothetical protein